MSHRLHRREFLRGAAAAGAAALGLLQPGRLLARPKNPTSPVSIARCRVCSSRWARSTSASPLARANNSRVA